MTSFQQWSSKSSVIGSLPLERSARSPSPFHAHPINLTGRGADVHFDLRSQPERWRRQLYRHNIPGRISVRTLTRRLILLAAMTTPFAAHLDANAQSNPQANPQANPQGWPAGTIKLVVPYPP